MFKPTSGNPPRLSHGNPPPRPPRAFERNHDVQQPDAFESIRATLQIHESVRARLKEKEFNRNSRNSFNDGLRRLTDEQLLEMSNWIRDYTLDTNEQLKQLNGPLAKVLARQQRAKLKTDHERLIELSKLTADEMRRRLQEQQANRQ